MAASLLDERAALTVQGGYHVVTGIAPFVSRRAFEAVTGPAAGPASVPARRGAQVTVLAAATRTRVVRRGP